MSNFLMSEEATGQIHMVLAGVSGWQEELGSRKTLIGIPPVLFTGCLTLGMLLNLSGLLFSHAKNDDFNTTFVY